MDIYIDILTDIRKILRSINLESKRIQKDFGISIPQLLCLSYLKSCEGYQLTHKELTKYLNLNSSTVTGIINRLEKKGFVARLPKKNDKRITNIALTSLGYQVLEDSPDLLHDKLSKELSNYPQEKVAAIKESMTLLIAALGIADMEASPVITMEEPIAPAE